MELTNKTLEIIQELGYIETSAIDNIEQFQKALDRIGYKSHLSSDTNKLIINNDDDVTKYKGVKKAISDFNNWNNSTRIYIDMENRKVWTCLYTDGNSWNRYDSNRIIEVYNKLWIYEIDTKITMNQLKEEIQKSINAYNENQENYRMFR